MNLAARARARKAAGEKFDFEARRTRLQAAAEAAAAKRLEAAAAEEGLPPPEAPAPPAPRRPNAAAASAARKAAERAAANDNDLDSRDLSAYDQMLLKLHQDRKSLSAIQATAGKIALKRELLPSYEAWVAGKVAADEIARETARATGQTQPRAPQDDVLVAVMIWSIDIGDYDGALVLAEYCQRHNQALPDKIRRDLANFVTEEIAQAAITAYKRGPAEGEPAAGVFPGGVLADVEILFHGVDMFDEVKAKLQKALGMALIASIGPDTPDDQARAARTRAVEHLREATDLNPASGVVKLIEGLERELKKDVAQ